MHGLARGSSSVEVESGECGDLVAVWTDGWMDWMTRLEDRLHGC